MSASEAILPGPLDVPLYDFSKDLGGTYCKHKLGLLRLDPDDEYRLSFDYQNYDCLRVTVHCGNNTRHTSARPFLVRLSYKKFGELSPSWRSRIVVSVKQKMFIQGVGNVGLPLKQIEFDCTPLFEGQSCGAAKEVQATSSNPTVFESTEKTHSLAQERTTESTRDVLASFLAEECQGTGPSKCSAPKPSKHDASTLCKNTFEMVLSNINDIARAKANELSLEDDGTPTPMARATLLLFKAAVSETQFSDATIVWKNSCGVSDDLYKFLQFASEAETSVLDRVSVTITPTTEHVAPTISVVGTPSPLLDDPLRQVALLYWQLTCGQ